MSHFKKYLHHKEQTGRNKMIYGGHSIITFSQNEQNLNSSLPPCSYLFDFGNPPPCERSKLYINHPPPPRHTQSHHHQTLTKTINSVILEIHKQLLKSASINTTKNIPLIWMLPAYPLTEIVLTIKVSIE